jgi:hypothetical protein
VLDAKVDQVNINVERCLQYLESNDEENKCCVTYSMFFSYFFFKKKIVLFLGNFEQLCFCSVLLNTLWFIFFF